MTTQILKMYKASTARDKNNEYTRNEQLLLYPCITEHKKYPKKLEYKMSIRAIYTKVRSYRHA